VIEAEMKAVVRDQPALLAALDRWAVGEVATYFDTYYDTVDRALTALDQELRLRVIEPAHRCLLTFKQSAIPGTDSRPEHETSVADGGVIQALFAALGLRVWHRLTKRCRNYRFERDGYQLLASVVTLPELTGCWLELESLVAGSEQLTGALYVIGALLAELGISSADLDRRTYTGMVTEARARCSG
jgi:adenylate cyclase class 2